MGNHGCSAVDVAERLPQQHCQFAIPGGCINSVISRQQGYLVKQAIKVADMTVRAAVFNTQTWKTLPNDE